MTNFSHDNIGRRLAKDLYEKIEQIYQQKMYKPDENFMAILSNREKEAYLLCLEEENIKLKEEIKHQIFNESLQ